MTTVADRDTPLAADRIRELESALERLRTFNRAVTHEVRNRLGAVISAGELLALGCEAGARQVEFADIILRNAQEMRATVDNLLVLARLEDDPEENYHESFRTLVSEVLEQVRPLAQEAHVDLRVAGALPDVEVHGAARLMLTNYLDNAVKYRDPDAIDSSARIEVGIGARHAGETEVIVRVLDNGLGVAPEKRGSLFERFFRAHPQTREHGTGLGLSIVREMANALGGRAWADFTAAGTAFCFALPCRAPAAPRAARHRSRQLEQPVG